MKRNISRVLLEATQNKLDEWTGKVKNAIEARELEAKAHQEKEQKLKTYEENKQKLATKFKEAYDKGVPIRELSRITGISSATIGRWIKELKEKEKQQHA